jgi:hypothetical protein
VLLGEVCVAAAALGTDLPVDVAFADWFVLLDLASTFWRRLSRSARSVWSRTTAGSSIGSGPTPPGVVAAMSEDVFCKGGVGDVDQVVFSHPHGFGVAGYEVLCPS